MKLFMHIATGSVDTRENWELACDTDESAFDGESREQMFDRYEANGDMEALSFEQLKKYYIETKQAELTNRLIPGDEKFENPEWMGMGKIGMLGAGYVEVACFYRTTPEDQEAVNENGGDWGSIAGDWMDRITKFEFADMIGNIGAEIES